MHEFSVRCDINWHTIYRLVDNTYEYHVNVLSQCNLVLILACVHPSLAREHVTIVSHSSEADIYHQFCSPIHPCCLNARRLL